MAISRVSTGKDKGTGTTRTVPLTVSNPNSYIVFAVAYETAGVGVASCRWNGTSQNLTQVAFKENTDGNVIVYVLKNPDVVTSNVVIVSGTTEAIAFGVVYEGVDLSGNGYRTSVAGTSGNNTSPSDSATSVAGDTVFSAMGSGAAGTVSSSDTLVDSDISGSGTSGINGGISEKIATGASTTLNWTIGTSDQWSVIALSLIPLAGTTYDDSISLAAQPALTSSGLLTIAPSLSLPAVPALVGLGQCDFPRGVSLAAIVVANGISSLDFGQAIQLDSIEGSGAFGGIVLAKAAQLDAIAATVMSGTLALDKTAVLSVVASFTNAADLTVARSVSFPGVLTAQVSPAGSDFDVTITLATIDTSWAADALIVEKSVSLATTETLDAIGGLDFEAALDLVAVGSLAGAVTFTIDVAASLAAVSNVGAAGALVASPAVSFGATVTDAAAGTLVIEIAAALAALSGLGLAAQLATAASAGFATQAALAGAGGLNTHGSALLRAAMAASAIGRLDLGAVAALAVAQGIASVGKLTILADATLNVALILDASGAVVGIVSAPAQLVLLDAVAIGFEIPAETLASIFVATPSAPVLELMIPGETARLAVEPARAITIEVSVEKA